MDSLPNSIEFNEKYHFYGKPCVKCDGVIRNIKSKNCIACSCKRSREYREVDSEKAREGNRESNRRYREANREKERERSYKQYHANIEVMRERNRKRYHANSEYGREYRAANREKLREYNRKWREANPEYNREYRESNPDKMSMHRHKRRAHLANNKHEPYNFSEICERHNNTCLACGATDVKLTVDHIIPVSKGGADAGWNIQPLCLSCNISKGNRHNTNYIIPPPPSLNSMPDESTQIPPKTTPPPTIPPAPGFNDSP